MTHRNTFLIGTAAAMMLAAASPSWSAAMAVGPQAPAAQVPLVLAQAEQTEVSERLRKRREAAREAKRQQKQKEEAERQAKEQNKRADDKDGKKAERRDRDDDRKQEGRADRRDGDERREDRAQRRDRDNDNSGRQNRHEDWDDDYDRDELRRADRRCTADRALARAERLGLRRARVVDVGRRYIDVRGRRYGERIFVTFARDRSCTVIDVR